MALKRKVTVLNSIRVESVGLRDLVYLKDTNIRAFVVSCPKEPVRGEAAVRGHYVFSRKFAGMGARKINPALAEYLLWKESESPWLFPMSRSHGRGEHPWHSEREVKRPNKHEK